MILNIPELLNTNQLTQAREFLEKADWINGKISAGAQAAQVKNNQEISKDSPSAQKLGQIITTALASNKLFAMAALPVKVSPPAFNRYENQQTYGPHIDNAIRPLPGGGLIRGDISATLFLSNPDEYDGGELAVEDTFGTHQIKLPAGHMVIYPASSLHQVKPITRGARLASFFWIQSIIRNDQQRTLLLDLELATQTLRQSHPQHPSITALVGVYNNLLRQWAEA
jgi:PKHD-type hydroxylase